MLQTQSVHPRLRGELHITAKRLATSTGSSPLARGTLNFKLSLRIKGRFIPACAGNSQAFFEIFKRFSVHPRLRGELDVFPKMFSPRGGSSPLARGTRYAVNTDVDFSRFIPACAGNSRKYRMLFFGITVHPRLRGELDVWHLAQKFDTGSSPLARGTRKETGCRRQLRWFIPACAGNS